VLLAQARFKRRSKAGTLRLEKALAALGKHAELRVV
jgi:hypothetical protein